MELDDKNRGRSRTAFDEAGAAEPSRPKAPIDGRQFRDIPLPSRVQGHHPQTRDILPPSNRVLK
jgi:hypothetical protein